MVQSHFTFNVFYFLFHFFDPLFLFSFNLFHFEFLVPFQILEPPHPFLSPLHKFKQRRKFAPVRALELPMFVVQIAVEVGFKLIIVL